MRTVRVWDLPTRVFHWLLAVAVAAQVTLGKIGGNALQWHFRIGYCILALLIFRIIWGLVGGHWSRFANFSYSPRTLMRYLRDERRPGDQFEVGHSPLGSASVLAMLAILTFQVATGLVADDEIANVGPLNGFVSNATALQATAWHKGPGQAILITLVVLHLGAVLFYWLRKGRDLIAPMISGDKQIDVPAPAANDSNWVRIGALALLAVSAGVVAWLVNLGS